MKQNATNRYTECVSEEGQYIVNGRRARLQVQKENEPKHKNTMALEESHRAWSRMQQGQQWMS